MSGLAPAPQQPARVSNPRPHRTPPFAPSAVDAGYADTTSNILNKWFHTFFPQALKLGLELDALGGAERLKFLAQSWVVSLFLDCPPGLPGLICPSAGELSNFTRAVQAGYIYWHAFPFNGEPELMSPDMFLAAVELTHSLDARFGLPPKATLSQRDVPGMTRAVVPALAAAGVRAITVGVNPWSTPPAVPRAFVWRDAESGVSLPSMWHPNFYGGIGLEDAVILPGLAHAVVFDWRGDNAGPPASVAEVQNDWATIAAEFPGAQIVASTLDDFMALLTPAVLAALPVVTSEIGDTWLHGAASDPLKSAMSKRGAAERAACLAPGGGCAQGDPAVANFTRFLLKNAEHTWGESFGHFPDLKNWNNTDFHRALGTPGYAAAVLGSWVEQRTYGLDAALGALSAAHPLAARVRAAWADLRPGGAPALDGWAPMAAGAPTTVGPWTLAFDAGSGALSLLAAAGGAVWANSSADGSFLALAEYRTYSLTDVLKWEAAYNQQGPNKEFGRDPSSSVANAQTLVARQQLLGLWTRAGAGATSFLVRAHFAPPELRQDYGAPAELWLQLDVPLGAGALNLSLTVLNKTATRLADGLFLRFNASAGAALPSWRVHKIGSSVDPFDVVPGGNLRHHGVGAGVTAAGAGGASLFVGAPDAPVAVFGEPTIFPVPNATCGAPAASEGLSFFLNGQLWNTNYPFWFPFLTEDKDMRWRFTLAAS